MSEFNKYSTDGGATFIDVEDTNGRTMSEQLTRDTVGWTGKNLLNHTGENGATQGVTFTVNTNKSITLSGGTDSSHTASKDIKTYTGAELKALGSNLLLNGGDTKAYLALRTSSWTFIARSYGEDVAIDTTTLTDGTSYIITIGIGQNTNVEGVVIEPMIRLAAISDSTYEPYHDTVSDEITDVYKVMGEMGAKNLVPLKRSKYSDTVNSVTYTTDSYGIISLSGTSTGALNESIINRLSGILVLDAGTYKFSGGVNSQVYLILGKTVNNAWSEIARSDGNDSQFTITEQTMLGISMLIESNVDTTDMKVKPMIRFASDSDETYQPNVMTNLELTRLSTYYAENYNNTLVNAGIDTIIRAEYRHYGKVHFVHVEFTVGTNNIPAWTDLIGFDNAPNSGSVVIPVRDITDATKSAIKSAEILNKYIRTSHELLANNRYQMNITYIA